MSEHTFDLPERPEFQLSTTFGNTLSQVRTALSSADSSDQGFTESIERYCSDLELAFGNEKLNQSIDISGIVYLADADGDFAINLGIEVQGIVELEGAMINGFSIQTLPGESQLIILLEILDTVDDTSDEPNVTYYMEPENIFSLVVYPEEIPQEEIRNKLMGIAMRAKALLEDDEFKNIDPEDQRAVLELLSYEASRYFSGLYLGDFVHVDTEKFYIIDFDGHAFHYTHVIQKGREKTVVPAGTAQGCAFLETVIETDPEKFKKIDTPIENQPGIVLVDENSTPKYFIPLSDFNSLEVIKERYSS